MKAYATGLLLLLAATLPPSTAIARPIPGELLHKDSTGPGVTTLLERHRALRTRVDAGARAGWLDAAEAADLRADLKLLDDDVRRIAMGNVAYTPQRKFDALSARMGNLEAFVTSRQPKPRKRARRR